MAFILLLVNVLVQVATPRTDSVAALRLYTDFQREPPRAVRETIQREIEFIMAPIGWQFKWDSLRNAMGADISVSVAVVQFRGKCDIFNLTPIGTHVSILAATSVSDGRILPFSNVNCNGIRTLLAPALLSVVPPYREISFGRAVGRVVAHELYHILTKEQAHGSDGIGAAQVTAENLMAPDFRFGPREVQKLRANLLPIVSSYNSLVGVKTGTSNRDSVYFTSGCSGCHGWQGEGTRWGPPLPKGPGHYDADRLAVLLANTSSRMYKRAKGLNVLWPGLDDAQINLLSDYLKERFDGAPVAALSRYRLTKKLAPGIDSRHQAQKRMAIGLTTSSSGPYSSTHELVGVLSLPKRRA